METLKTSKVTKYTFIVMFLLLMYFISFHIPLNADDFGYSRSRIDGSIMNNLLDVIKSVGYEYMTWNGRILGYFFTQISLMHDNQIVFRIIYPIINLIIIFEIFDLVFDMKIYINLFVISALFLFAHVLQSNQTLFWIIGWCIYVLPLIFIIPLIKYFKNITSNKPNNIKPTVIFFLALSSSLFVESYSLLVLGLGLVSFIYEAIKNKKISLDTKLFCLGSIIGILIIFLAPGLNNRASEDLTATFTLAEKFHFGWSRFNYTFFYMNQRIFLVLNPLLIIYNLKKKDLLHTILLILSIPILIFTIILVIKPNIFGFEILESLTGEWSYYTVSKTALYKYSLIVIYYLIMYLINFISMIKDSGVYLVILYLAALCTSFIFLFSNMACERTSYISYVILMIISLEIMNSIDNQFLLELIKFFLIVSLIYSSYKYSLNYYKEYQIFKNNEELYTSCALNDCKEIYVYEHNYRYIFKSDLNFDKQNDWPLENIRTYYNLDSDVVIKNK